jgi:RHS repeat-associated protein
MVSLSEVASYDYEAFGGKYSPNTTESISQRYQYTGREMNPVSGLMDYRNRTYNPMTGRFERRDPAGYENNEYGDLYLYPVNPVCYIDPYGLVGGSMGWMTANEYRDNTPPVMRIRLVKTDATYRCKCVGWWWKVWQVRVVYDTTVQFEYEYYDQPIWDRYKKKYKVQSRLAAWNASYVKALTKLFNPWAGFDKKWRNIWSIQETHSFSTEEECIQAANRVYRNFIAAAKSNGLPHDWHE